MSKNDKNRTRGKRRVTFRTREEAIEALKRALEHDRKPPKAKEPKARD